MRRFVDVVAATVGAALLVLLVQAAPVWTAAISYPHVWSPGEILTSSDLNAQFAAITAQVNGNLDNSNIASSAAIVGSKLADAPSGVSTGKINDSAITSAKIADGTITGTDIAATTIGPEKLTSLAVVHNIVGAVFTGGAGAAGITAETTVLTLPSFTATGGKVLFLGMASASVSIATSGFVTWKLKRDGSTILQWPVAISESTSNAKVPVPTPVAIDMPSAGAHVYTLTIAASGGSVDISAGDSGTYQAIEIGA